ncbi:MAG: hypothetical protein AAFQ82_04620, partial [Myxococcota bacterium]
DGAWNHVHLALRLRLDKKRDALQAWPFRGAVKLEANVAGIFQSERPVVPAASLELDSVPYKVLAISKIVANGNCPVGHSFPRYANLCKQGST